MHWETLTLWRHWFAGACVATIPAVLIGMLSSALGFIVFFTIIGLYLWARQRLESQR
jgi:hypothetical protein